ncbi:hypothetical protein [Streptomyces inhibens]
MERAGQRQDAEQLALLVDETIKIIRSGTFGLRAHDSGRAAHGLRSRTVTAVEQAARTLGFTPSRADGTGRGQGEGIPRDGRRSGLNNLAKRAESMGGEMAIEVPPAGGTRLVWREPLPAE